MINVLAVQIKNIRNVVGDNMREFKFRAWDGNKMNYSPDLVTPNGKLSPNKLGWLVIMQSTGLKDSTGREIYEGDILTDWGFGGSINKPKLEVMKFKHGSWEPASSYQDWKNNILSYKIVGNIYENSELLEV